MKAPAVSNLDNLQNVIKNLKYTPIPYSYIDEGHLSDLEKQKKISKEIHKTIDDWKKEQGIPKPLSDIVRLNKY